MPIPELGFEEERTSEIVAASSPNTAARCIAVLRRPASSARCGAATRCARSASEPTWTACRCRRLNEFAHRSQHDGKMHGCGHDGHTTMLLGAARYLAETRNFEGTVHFIFQPGEEGYGGGRVMVQQGLFDKFPCDAVFAMHNKPGIPVGNMAVRAGADARRLRPLRSPHQGARRPCRPSAMRQRPVRHRRADRHGAADDRRRATSIRSNSAVVSIGFMRGGSPTT